MPRIAIGRLRRRGASLALGWLDRLPRPFRRLAYRPIGAFAGRILRGDGDHPTAAVIQVHALRASGHDDDALDLLADLAARRSWRGSSRLARIALTMRRPDIADRLLADEDPGAPRDVSLAGLRGTIDVDLGRYRSALGHLERAVAAHPDRGDLARKTVWLRGHLALLAPDWTPAIPPGPVIARGQRHRGRILHLVSKSLPYTQVGYTIRTQHVARSQLAVGLDPRMVTRAGFPGNVGVHGAPPEETVDGVPYVRLQPDLERGLPIDRIATETAIALAHVVETLRPVALQPATDYVQGKVAVAVAERYDLPVVYEVRGFLEQSWRSRIRGDGGDTDRYLLARAAETACMRRATAIVTLSETMRADILARGEIEPDRVVVIPNAVDIERFVPGARDEALAATFGIEPDETVVGYISSLNAYEGIRFVIEAVARLGRKGRRVRLLLVGDGDERAALEAVAAREGVLADRRVIFAGQVPYAAIERCYRLIDIFVMARTDEPVSRLVTPLKPYEAMAMEKALVVSSVDALLEIVRDGETGRTVPPEDVGALVDTIESLMDDPAERRRLGAAAREWVAANRTWTQNGDRYLALYRRLGLA